MSEMMLSEMALSGMTPETLKELLLTERGKGNVVLFDHEGFHIGPVSALVDQPVDGLLYDLNRLEEVALTFLPKDAQWVNNFAVALVIRELKGHIEALERTGQEFLDVLGAEMGDVPASLRVAEKLLAFKAALAKPPK